MIETAQRWKILDATAVKIIACIAMFIDHFAYIYAYRLGAVAYYVCRGIGRIAFPIFCFMIVEGVIHTRSLKKYLLRLTVFAVLLEAPSDLFLTGEVFSLEVQSVIITLLICACCVSLLKAVEERVHESGNIYLYWAVIVAAGCVLAEVSKGDYGYIGVVYASVFYIFRRNRAMSLLVFAMSSCVIYVARIIFGGFSIFGAVCLCSMLAAIPLSMYNGKQRSRSPVVKYGFYLFYPLHMLLLYVMEKYFTLF